MVLNRHMLRRFYTQKPAKPIEKAFTERLQQLDSEYVKDDDVLLGKEYQSLIDQDPKLSKLHKQLPQKVFDYQNQQSIQVAKVPNYAGKQARDIALSSPWTGQESQHDSNLRMLVDKHKPRIKTSTKKLASAKETVLDYKLNKHVPEDEDTAFRNIYKEKFTPIGSFDKIKTLADARIEEAIRQGQFKNIPRGKLDTEVKPYVDRTEHHLNNILIKQNIVPPWIEKQGGVNGEISGFRNELKRRWESHIKVFYHSDETEMRNHFKKKWKKEYDHRLILVNNSIRTYNLQAPLSTQKFYLLYDKEFDKCFQEVIVEQVREQLQEERAKKKADVEEQIGFSLKFWKWGATD